ncbi:hypothetical protein [Candidatus Enterococcus murrayae]|uniref:Uncharacterized protein n=1 Tax=Candidatus Enterococcus murrayae TaxID=2815321 RepID=A0ABS3HCI4_9ENTE|nr:hypothetical protein [Enterococcus sp. MJM16]MBO0451162.1 hypothetical protein [Enterococcus sp. MJM16]
MLSIIIILLAACLLFIYRHQQSTDKLANLREMEFTEEQWIKRETIGRSGEKHQLLLPEDWGFVLFEEMDVVEADCEFIARSNDRVKQMGCIITDKNEFSDLQIYKDRFRKIADVEAVVFSETYVDIKKINHTQFIVESNGEYDRYIYYIFESDTHFFEYFANSPVDQFLSDETTLDLMLRIVIELSNEVSEQEYWETKKIFIRHLTFLIDTPVNWQDSDTPISENSIFVLTNFDETEIVGCACDDKREYKDLDTYKSCMEKDLRKYEGQEIEFLEILTETDRYWVTEYESKQWGLPYHIFFYILEGKTQYIQLLSWTPINRPEAVDERIIKIMNSVREISDEWKDSIK